MRILPSPATATSDPPREQDWEPGVLIHAAGVRPFRRGYAAISSAPKARCVGGEFRSGDGIGLSCRGGTLELVAEILKVFRAALQLQHFFDRSEEHTSELQSLRHLVCRL